MVVHEFRIPLPLSVEEFGRGQLYMVAKVSAEHTSGDEGIEWIKNEPFDNTDGHLGTSAITGTVVPRSKGQYTLKRYLLRSKVPSLVAHLVPANALFLVEEAWNGYPHCKTVLVNGYMDKTRFRIDVETMHVDDNIAIENVLSLSPEELKHRKVEYLDIRNGKMAKDINKTAAHFRSTVTGRGPLEIGWEKDPKVKPRMCAYKIVRADFRYFGLQSTIEHKIISSQRELFTDTLAKAFMLLDEWYGMTIEEIRRVEAEVAVSARAQLATTLSGAASVHHGVHGKSSSSSRLSVEDTTAHSRGNGSTGVESAAPSAHAHVTT